MRKTIVLVSGVSGSGKSSLLRALLKELKKRKVQAVLVPSYTDRPLRYDQKPGEYRRVSKKTLQKYARYDGLLWQRTYAKAQYGIRKNDVLNALSKSKLVFVVGTPDCVVELQSFAETLDDVRVVALWREPPAEEERQKRLLARNLPQEKVDARAASDAELVGQMRALGQHFFVCHQFKGEGWREEALVEAFGYLGITTS